MFSIVLSSLVDFVEGNYKAPITEIPSAVLLTGINMPDHEAQFKTLGRKITDDVTPHVVYLHSQHCSNMKNLVENMVGQFVNVSNDCSFDSDTDKSSIKKSQCNFSLLQSWYESLSTKENLVVIITDFESFNEIVLQNFILIVR